MIATTYRQETRRPQWWARRAASFHYDRPAEVLAVLQHARSIVETGWVQNRWTRNERPQPMPAQSRSAVAVQATGDGTVSACVVAAVALAVRDRDPRADLAVATGPAIAHLWDAVHGDARFPRAAGRSAPHEVRIARMRELARWNDQPGRTHADVVDALDRAAARVVALTVEPERV
jgi:hypothetical protein